MTRYNLQVTLTNGQKIKCVADSSSAPEQGYLVEDVILPLLRMDDAGKQMALIRQHCTMNEQRSNATYRYKINLKSKRVSFFEERYDACKDRFYRGEDITERYDAYLYMIRK